MTRSAPAATVSSHGRQEPRVESVPEGVEHPDTVAALEVVEAAGILLDPWQKHVFRRSLLRLPTRWAAKEIGVCVPRQNGKNVLIEARSIAGLFVLGDNLIIHTAHLADTSREAFRRLEEVIDANDWLSREVAHIRRTNGHEAIELKSGQRIRFRTRTKGGGRGFTGVDCVFFDEAMILSEASFGAVYPVISAQPDPQVWYTGSPVDQAVHDDGMVFARVRERGAAGGDPSLAWFEWSVDADTPDDVDDDVAGSIEAWRAANPALGIRISTDNVADERRAMDRRTFAVERLGVGDWPVTDGTADMVINPAAWDALLDPDSKLVSAPWLSYDITPNRARTTISAVGRRDDGLFHPEVIERRNGTGGVAARIAELATNHNAAGVVCDSVGPAASLVWELEELGVEVTQLNTQEVAQACELMVDLVEQAKLRHLGSPEVKSAIKGAARRQLGERWAWSRRNSTVDITPLVTFTNGLWCASPTGKTAEIMVAFG